MRNFIFRRPLALAKNETAQTAVAGGEVFFASVDAAAEVSAPTARTQMRLDITDALFSSSLAVAAPRRAQVVGAFNTGSCTDDDYDAVCASL
jgi:hypothetical protein